MSRLWLRFGYTLTDKKSEPSKPGLLQFSHNNCRTVHHIVLSVQSRQAKSQASLLAKKNGPLKLYMYH